MTGYTWTVSAGGTITAGANTNTITIVWNTSGPNTVSATFTDPATGCAALTPTIYNVTVNTSPVITITGNNTVCAGTTGVVYTTQAAMSAYTWTISAGGTITAGAGTNSITVTWNTAGAQTVSVNYTNLVACSALVPAVYNVTVNALPVVTLTGNTTAGVGTSNVYTTQTGMTNYLWTVSAGGTITAGGGSGNNTATVLWNTAGAQTVCVNYQSNGCYAAAPTCLPVNVVSIPPPAGTITGPASVCQGATGVVFTVPTIPNATGYVWSLPTGATITAGANTNTITVSFSYAAVSGVITVYGTNTFGNGTPSPNFSLTVNLPPAPVITGPASVCVNAIGNVYTTQTGMTNYVWSVSAGGTITAGGTATSNTVTVTWNTAGAQTVSVNYTNASLCTAAAPVSYPVTVNALPVPVITGPATSCNGSTGNVYTTQTGMSGYTWSISAGGTITGGAGTSSITVTWTALGAQYVRVNYTNVSGCTAAAPVQYNVTISTMTAPTITGTSSLCVNSGYYDYTTQPGMNNYVWTVSAGGTINFGAGTNDIQVSWTASGAQTVTVNYTTPGGCTAGVPTSFPVTVNPLPGTAGAITGTATVCGGTNGVAYSIPAVNNATSYVWNLPPGATIVTGAGTRNITVNFAPNASSGNIVAFGNNVCGNGAPSPPYALTANPLPAPAGTITGPVSVCEGSTGIVYSIGSLPVATGYVWTVPAGVTIVSGSNTNSITVNFTGAAVSGTIAVHGTNTCGNGGPSNPFTVTVNPIPATPTITAVGPVLTSSAASGNQWVKEGTPITGETGQSFTATHTGHYWTIVTLNGCSSDTSNHLYVEFVGISNNTAPGFELYPVPNDGKFNISITSPTVATFTIDIYNNLGSKIYEDVNVRVNGKLEKSIDLRPIPDGVYTVTLKNSDNQLVRKIVIRK